jgi:predicted aspartyl protease
MRRAAWLPNCAALLLLAVEVGLSAQQGISVREREEIDRRRQPPAAIGMKLSVAGGRLSIDTGERLHADPPVILSLWELAAPVPAIGVRLNGGRQEPFILDTGAMFNLVPAAVALRHKLDIADPGMLQMSAAGFGGAERVYWGRIGSLQAGKLTGTNVLTGLRLQVHEHRILGGLAVSRMHVNLLGLPTLARLSYFTLNHQAGTAEFASARQYPEPPGRKLVAQVPFTRIEDKLVVTVRINGTNELEAVLDTGATGGLMLNEKSLPRLGLEALARSGSGSRAFAIGGELTTRVFTLPKIELGGTTFTGVRGESHAADFDAFLGYDLLRRYKATFDFRRNVLWLEYWR